MAENYKHLYEQTKLMLTKYQDEIVPGFRKVIADLESKQPILCQNCTHHDTEDCPQNRVWCKMLRRYMKLDGYCSYGERKEE